MLFKTCVASESIYFMPGGTVCTLYARGGVVGIV